MNRIAFNGVSGQIQFMEKWEFVQRVRIHRLEPEVKYFEYIKSPTSPPVFDPTEGFLQGAIPGIAQNYDKVRATVSRYLTPLDLVMVADSSALDQVRISKMTELMVRDLDAIVARKVPELFIKDLSIEAIEDLSVKFAERFGGNACGVHHALSPYQKFFIITTEEDFCFYSTTLEDGEAGRLVCHNEGRMVLGRYENSTYLKEMAAERARYSAFTFPDESHKTETKEEKEDWSFEDDENLD